MDDRDLIAPGEHEDELAAQASEGEFNPEGPNENWLVSYADLMTLLFGFFAMLYLTQVLNPPAPPPPQPPAAQEKKQEPSQPREPESPRPLPPNLEPPPIAYRIPEMPPLSRAGGNRGFALLELFPPALLKAVAIIVFAYVSLFLLGLRRHRIIVDPVTGAAAVRRVPLLKLAQLAGEARKPLTPEQAALKAKEEEILRLDGPDELVELEEEHGETWHMTDERWLISYADLMTLLFGFYAMLYLMGPNFEAVKSAMDQSFTKAMRPAMPQRPIQMPHVPPMTMPEAPVATAPEVKVAAETKPETTAAPETVAETKTAVQTETQTVAEAPAAPKPRPTPTREEMERMEEERRAALQARLARRAQKNAQGGYPGGNASRGGSEGPATTKGKGGKGIGGGRGGGVGGGASDAAGSAICSEGALAPYSPTCWGSGFFGCLTTGQLAATGGLNGEGSALELYCVGGRTRLCLTHEYCPWRQGPPFSPEDYPNGFQESSAVPDTMSCSPSGLAISGGRPGFMAECRDRPMCNFARIECDPMGRLNVR